MDKQVQTTGLTTPVLTELERQVERASFFTHTSIGQNAIRLSEVESFLYGTMDVLMEKGLVSSGEVLSFADRVRKEQMATGDICMTGVELRIGEGEAATERVEVNCAERMHVCRAICCKLDFALSEDEVEAGRVKWDLGRPYCIRHGMNGSCVHNEGSTGCCTVYEERPAICKTYSCATDERIWSDFERMELNVAWLEENLSETAEPRLMGALMQAIEPAESAALREPEQGGEEK